MWHTDCSRSPLAFARKENDYDVSLLISFTHICAAIGRQGWFVAAIIGLGIRFPFPTAAFAIARRDAHPQPRLLKYARIELAVPDMIGSGVLDNARLKSKRRRHD